MTVLWSFGGSLTGEGGLCCFHVGDTSSGDNGLIPCEDKWGAVSQQGVGVLLPTGQQSGQESRSEKSPDAWLSVYNSRRLAKVFPVGTAPIRSGGPLPPPLSILPARGWPQ